MKHSKRERAPILSIAEVSTVANGNPITFLRAFHTIAQSPNRGEIAFDHEVLSWMVRMWEHAAIAAAGNPTLHAECIKERDRCRHFYKVLTEGQGERNAFGAVYFDNKSDWPHPEIVKQAVKALAHAQIASVH
jgi:hypothetical protein